MVDLLLLLASDRQEEHGRRLPDHAVDRDTWERLSARTLSLPPMKWGGWLPAQPPAFVPVSGGGDIGLP